MKYFFGIRKRYARDAFCLRVDYSFDVIDDPLKLNFGAVSQQQFLTIFSYQAGAGKTAEDLQNNNIGWFVFSPRITSILKSSRNSDDLCWFKLPLSVTDFHPALEGYCAFGLKRQLTCLNTAGAEIRWTTDSAGHKKPLALIDYQLFGAEIPEACDVFYISDYPFFPIVSAELAERIAALRPSGFVFERIEAI